MARSDSQDQSLVPTASQTVGPFFHLGLAHLQSHFVPVRATENATITIRGRVLDGNGVAVPDFVLEVWQARPDGAYDEGSLGFGRILSDDAGGFSFTTLRPGCVPARRVTALAEHQPHVRPVGKALGYERDGQLLHTIGHGDDAPGNQRRRRGAGPN